MIGSVKTFSIRGGCFEDTTSLELFKEPFNILFGRNGSGKTTITRGIKAYKDSEASTFETSFDVSIPEEERKYIHVFNGKHPTLILAVCQISVIFVPCFI